MSGVHFEFATATEIVFGPGAAKGVADRVRQLGTRPMLVTGRDPSRADAVLGGLRAAGVSWVLRQVVGEPTIEDAREAAAEARERGVDVVIGVGGGSVIDLGKAVAALLTNPGDPLDYVEVIGRGQPITARAAPYVAVPTTAGTGAEVTRNAVLGSATDRVKVSMRSVLMLPRLAVVDPELTVGLPAEVTASTGMDALTQVIEPYLSTRANPMTDALCLDAIPRVARSLRRAAADGHDLDARSDMALASLMGGLALANAGLGAVHGFAAPIGGRFAAPHGAVCAALLPIVMRANLRALQTRAAQAHSGDAARTLARFDTVARRLTGDATASADRGIEWLERLRDDLRIPGLAAYGVQPRDAAKLAEAATRASSMRANPVALDLEELKAIVIAAI